MKIKVKNLARLHIISIVAVGMFMSYDTPVITAYVVYSFFLWIFGYPLYYLLGEPGWDDY